MQLNQQELATIVQKAQSLWERLEGDIVPAPTHDPQVETKIAARLQQWRDIVAEGDEELFEKRLAYDRLDRDTVRRLLGNGTMAGAAALPDWTTLLNAILQHTTEFPLAALEAEGAGQYPFLDKDAPIPFEEVFVPCILVARARLMPACGDRYGLLSAPAHAAFERLLVQRLSAISCRVLEVEFATFIACLQFEGLSYQSVKAAVTSRTQYVRFVKTLYAGELASLFQEYSVWARRLAVRIQQWVQLTAEFLARLHADLPDIQHVFAGDQALGKVASVEPGLSDSHAQGRTVVAVTFAAGLRVVYKPKDMGLEVDYFHLVDWLNDHGAPLSFGTLQIINRGTYGWAEYAEHRPMATYEEAQRYFQRAGMLLGLIYLFDGIDFHQENIVACGEYPVPIDLETFFHHRMHYPQDVRELVSASSDVLNNSVLRTHFLPNLYKMQGQFFDISGMGAVPGQEKSVQVLQWQHINTDAMAFHYETVKPNPAKNAPRIKDASLVPEEYTEEIVDGFCRMYRIVMDQRETLCGTESLMPRLFVNRARFVFRATDFYASLEQHVLYSDYQREGVDLSLQLEMLSRSFLPLQEKPLFWPMIREEQKSLWDMDVPKFTAQGSSDSLALEGGEVVQHCFSGSPGKRVKEKIRGPQEKDLARQVELIKGAMEARTPFARLHSVMPHHATAAPDEAPLMEKSDLIQHALALAEELCAKADYSPQGEPSWMTLKIIPDTEQGMLAATDFSLYDGCSGIALFLSALARVVPGSGFGDMAYATIALMRRWLKKARPYEIAQLGIGGCAGLGSIVYALVRMGDLLNDPALVQEGHYAASLMREKDIDADTIYDVLAGAAGAILGLLACHKSTGDPHMLDTAVYCGQHLLRHRVQTTAGFQVWKTLGDTPLLGFSHGAAGIAYALLQLHQACGESAFRAAAQDAIAYETHTFVGEANDWPDLRARQDHAAADDPQFMCAWCNGAAGIGLARLGGLESLVSDSIRRDIDTALHITRQTALQPRDHLCCGNLGRAETLFTAGLKLAQPHWVEAARQLTAQVATRATRQGAFQLGVWQHVFSPGLFQGVAGIGYHLLRLAAPAQVPALLLLE